jgi:hypothetical protein
VNPSHFQQQQPVRQQKQTYPEPGTEGFCFQLRLQGFIEEEFIDFILRSLSGIHT